MRKSSFKKNAVKADINQKITDMILKSLKSGVLPWVQPFENTDFKSFTAFHSGKEYKGINTVLLWITKQEHQLTSNGFLTFNHGSDIAGIKQSDIEAVRDKKKPEVTLESINHPLAGQKSVGFVVFQSPIYKDENGKTWFKKEANGSIRREPTNAEMAKDKIQQVWVSKSYAVWSVDQMSYMPEKWLDKRNNAGKVINQDVLGNTQNDVLRNLAQQLIKKNGIKVVVGDKPDYDFEKDVIVMPKINDFVSDSSFYRSLVHQLVHWTGGKDRLDRGFDKVFGSQSDLQKLAQEELVAELGAAFVCQRSGIDTFTSANLEGHASLINPWINIMEDNKKAIIFSASKAEKAAEFLIKSLDLEPKIEVKNEMAR